MIPLRVLILEDVATDAELLVSQLRKSGFDPRWQVVATEQEFAAHLDPALELILADYTLRQFDARRALEILRERGLEIPFVVVTGSIDEETAVDLIKQGANDYLMKDRLSRLGPAIVRALQEKRDITDRKLAEDALRETQYRFALFLEHLPGLAFIKDSQGRYVYGNQAWKAQFPGEVDCLGKTDSDLWPGDVAAVFQQSDRFVLENNTPFQAIEIGREQRSWLIHKFPIHQLDRPILVGGIAIDVTARQRLEERLIRSQRLEAIGRLTSGIAHDFNNMLTSILGFAGLALGALKENEPVREDLREIQKAADRATSLVRQLLAFSRKQVLESKVVDLNSIVSEIEKMLGRLIGEDIQLVSVLEPSPLYIKADPGQIGQVIMNLCVNARDAMPNGGRLLIATASEAFTEDQTEDAFIMQAGTYARLTLTDDGIGMDAETRAQIFEPFFTTKEKGTGLGLATCYGIIKQSGGYIFVESEIGKGTTFKIYLAKFTETR